MYRGWRFCRVISIGIVLGLAFAGLLITPFGSAERTEPGVKGTVTDGTGTPLEGVEIRVVKLDMSGGNGSYTNSTGEYLVNITEPGSYLVAFVMDGYFERTQVFQISGVDLMTIDASLNSMPAETEQVRGILRNSDEVAVMGYEVTLLYEEGSDRHEYSAVTDGTGMFSWMVFPGEFTFEVHDQGLAVYSEDITISLGDGPVELSPYLPDLPQKDVTIKGYISNGTDPLEEAMVGIMDSNNDIFNLTFSNETGYFELGFWAGFHYIVSFTDGYEGYFRGLQIAGGETMWVNFTLVEEEYFIKGVVNSPDGEPMEGVSVQYLQRYVFPETNSATTDSDGEFRIDVAGGDGYLMVVDDNPFESGEFDVYFEQYSDLTSNKDVTIDLTDNDMNTGIAGVNFENWTHFSSASRMQLPLNNSRAGRAMVDLMIGDGDLMISQSEFEQWEETMMGDDSDLSEGPFGNNTDGNITLNGLSFLMDEGTMDTQIVNFTGPIYSTSQLELKQSASYTLQGDEPVGVMRELSFNGSYNDGNEEMVMHLLIPEGWRTVDVTNTLHDVTFEGRNVRLEVADDPNPEDELDSEWASLTFFDDTFSVVIDPVEPVGEGEEVLVTLNITDNIPENDYEVNWSLDGTELENETKLNLSLMFLEDGTFEIQVDIIDHYGRETQHVISIDVENLAPAVELEIIGGLNRSFVEGTVVGLRVNASDPGMDDLTIQWGMLGVFGDTYNYTDENRTMDFVLSDDGTVTFQVRITDEDNGTMMDEITIEVGDLPPTIEYQIEEEGSPGDLDVKQGENITIFLSDLTHSSINDTISIDWIIPETGISHYFFDDDMSISMIFINAGDHKIAVNISDEDGGFTIKQFNFVVEENFTFDQDGDGLPKWWEDDKGLSDTFADDALMDPDMDNLTNLQEYDLGTKHNESDSDGDGVPDNWDGFPLDASKYDKDSDEDGTFDWDEILGGTDPLDPEDYPGKKSGKNDDGCLIYLVLLMIGILLIIGIMALMISRSKQKGLEYEE
jgi:carboxypeptidase family protein